MSAADLTCAQQSMDERIAGALEKCAASVERPARGRWSFPLSNGSTFRVAARIDDVWLLLDAVLQPAAVAGWELLEMNATLPGGAKFAMPPDQSAIHVRAELPLAEDIDVARRIQQVCGGFQHSSARLHRLPPIAIDPLDAPSGSNIELAQLCRATQWPCIEREGGMLAIDLQVPGALRQAVVAARADGRIEVVTALETTDVSGDCRDAVALLLLRTCGGVRMARAAVSGGVPRFEVIFADTPTAAELAHAVSALSVACRWAAREAELLARDSFTARKYLDASAQVQRTEGDFPAAAQITPTLGYAEDATTTELTAES